MARVSLRVTFTDETALGPGKVRLLELIAETGSISAAGRAMAMSYRRAWNLVDDLNATFEEPLVSAQPGGSKGGGASLTQTGREVIRRYRAIDAAVAAHARGHVDALTKMLAAPNKKRRSMRAK
jgi:molybdate transport system regulatory protein